MRPTPHAGGRLFAAAVLLLSSSCAESPAETAPPLGAARARLEVACEVSLQVKRVSCGAPVSVGANHTLVGGQNTNVRLASGNVSYNSGTGIFQFDATVQNLLNEKMGTPDGVTADAQGIQVFFASGPNVTVGTGSVTVANADGTGTFTGVNQPFFAYQEILAKDQESSAKTWQLQVTGAVESFGFTLYIETDLEPKLVINEFMANPGGAVQDSTGEYVEIYNAGSWPVDLNGFQVSDNSGVTEVTPHVIASSVVVAPGGYVVLGRSQNTAKNGGITVNYVYSPNSQVTQFQFSNSAGDVFRLKAPNGVVIDSIGYTTSAVSAVANTARELLNPALDNANGDGASWGPATTNYDASNKGTPGAVNAAFVP